jgi:hypothetical protein
MDYPTMIEGRVICDAADHVQRVTDFRNHAALRRAQSERMAREAVEADRIADVLAKALEGS